ncbi:MAG: hypothetical protein ABFQ95_05490 [Pseudomonadota bacterium]
MKKSVDSLWYFIVFVAFATPNLNQKVAATDIVEVPVMVSVANSNKNFTEFNGKRAKVNLTVQNRWDQ